MKISTIIHPIAILVWLLIPLMFIGPYEEISIKRYLFNSCMPFMMLLVFYLNYLWILPRHIEGKSKLKVLPINAILIVVVCVLVALVRTYEFTVSPPPRFPIHEDAPEYSTDFSWLFLFLVFIRDALNLIFVVLIAYSLRMSKHAHRLEHERQEAEVARRDAELNGLRLQISPHFLLNTRNNI